MSLDDLLKGLSVFNLGVTQAASSKAINDANEQVQQLNMVEMDRAERIQAQSQIGNELALKLSSVGADPSKIQSVIGQLSPSAGAQFQAEENLALQQKSQEFQASESALDRALKRELAAMDQKVASSKAGQARLKELGSALQRDQTRLTSAISKDMESLKQANTAMSAIQSNKPIGIDFARMALAKSQTGAQMTDAEREVFKGSQALSARIKQAAQNIIAGNATAENQKLLADVAKKLQKSTQQAIKTKADLVTRQSFERLKKTGFETTEDEVRSIIAPLDILGTTIKEESIGSSTTTKPQQPDASKYFKDL